MEPLEKVVYILGAGFSAPHKLPVIRDFWHKSQDMYLRDTEHYNYFMDVFNTIGGMSMMKNYYDVDLLNIEEVLSILEMGRFLDGNKDAFTKYIDYLVDVIKFYTPEMPPYHTHLPSNWNVVLFGSRLWTSYGYFIASILNSRIDWPSSAVSSEYKHLQFLHRPEPEARYSIITMNYDMIPEMVTEFINTHFSTPEGPVEFSYPTPELANLYPPTAHVTPRLAKLHGSVHDKSIVPPTWNKGNNQTIVPAWNLASGLLSSATQIRILGYSLPVNDTYIKYLLRSAFVGGFRFLKNIDVICRDTSGAVKARYDEFIKFKFYRFANATLEDYLHFHHAQYPEPSRVPVPGIYMFDKLDTAHERFMAGERPKRP